MRTIEQYVQFDEVTPEELFEMYLDPRKHSRAIGAPVTMSREPGSTFAAFGERSVRGKTLLIAPKSRIVQTWRAEVWRDFEPDSVLVLTFTKTANGAAVDLVQAGVPDAVYDTIHRGWFDMYWKRWREYLQAAKVAEQP